MPPFAQFVQVLDLSSTDGSELVNKSAQAIFLDEFRVVVIPDRLAITELAVFDTLIPQDHPGYLQRLMFPPEFCNKPAKIHVDGDRDLGTPDKDEVLLPDPAQAVLALCIAQDQGSVLLVVRTQVLVKQVDSVRTDCRIPWDEWGRDAVAIQLQGDEVFTLVHGAQVMVVCDSYNIRTFDFGQRGHGSLPLQRRGDGPERRVLFGDGVNVRFKPDRICPWGSLESLSDGSVINLVSFLAHYVTREVVG